MTSWHRESTHPGAGPALADRIDHLGSSLPWPREGQASVHVDGLGHIGTYGRQQPVPIASITKVMTAYVILRAHPLEPGEKGPRLSVDRIAEAESESTEESTVPLRCGRTLTQRKALELLLVPSGSNVGRMLARWHAGDESAFVREMNATAAALGMSDTTYTDVCGIRPSTRSTSDDQLKLARAAMDIPAFRSIVARRGVLMPGLRGYLCNTNRLLGKPGVVGLKTGTTTPAGGNLLWAAMAGGRGSERLVLGAVLRQRPDTSLPESQQAVRQISHRMIAEARRALHRSTAPRHRAAPFGRRAGRTADQAWNRYLEVTGSLGYQSHYYMARAAAWTRYLLRRLTSASS
ncbi:D-alanyl-D-alanine carboxypeptidase family protein [Kitasatospora sp. NPDC101176]|uniref:D-alanyl-D-alanine carboxypeptidase family protein n=1 Tax=Kitasatospora sp. NPDC101176 TaxID=3364099 RepID=UPI00382F41CF